MHDKTRRTLALICGACLAAGMAVGSTTAAAAPVIGAYPILDGTSQPGSIATGPDGNVWFTETLLSNVGRITPSGRITEFPLPTPFDTLSDITSGPGGYLWGVTTSRFVDRISTTGAVAEFSFTGFPLRITPGPDGNLWITDPSSDAIARFTPSGVEQEFLSPTAFANPVDIAAGPDGNLWFTESNANKIGRITPSGVITEFALPNPNSSPDGIAAGPPGPLDEQWMWFTEDAGRIGRINTSTHVITEFAQPGLNLVAGPDGLSMWFTDPPNEVGSINSLGLVHLYATPPVNYLPQDITFGADNNPWFTDFEANRIGTIVTSGTGYNDFLIPSRTTLPQGITKGPDGNIWFAETLVSEVGKMTPTGAFTEFGNGPANGFPNDIATGPDGKLYLTLGSGQIEQLTTGGTVNLFSPPTISFLQGITAGPDGNIWFTETGNNNVGRMTTSGVITEFPVITPAVSPFDIVTGPDGNLWFTELGGKVAKITTAGVVTEFEVGVSSIPGAIASGPDGNLWFTDGAGMIGRVTTAGVVTEFPVPTVGAGLNDIAAGPDGNLWFTEEAANKIGRITTAGVVTEFEVPTPDSEPYDIVAGPSSTMWFTELHGNNVAFISICTTPSMAGSRGGACQAAPGPVGVRPTGQSGPIPSPSPRISLGRLPLPVP